MAIDPDGNTTAYYYDAVGNNTLMVEGVGSSAVSSTSMAYDAAGNETLVVTGYGTASAESTFYAYDANGNQTEVITGYNSSQPDTTISQYDGDGNLTQQTDPDGDVSDFLYDSLGDQTLSVLGAGTAQAASGHEYYDGDDNLTLSIDADGDSTSYLYDADGDETLAIQGYGSSAASTSSYAYDAAGEQTLAVTGYGTTAAESAFHAYDANGNQTLTITGYNSSKPESTVSRYDGDGNRTQQIDADGDTSDFAYDALGDQTLSVLGAGTAQAASSHDYYDGDDNLTLSVDADGDSTSYLYDADGNNTLTIEGVGTSSASTTSMAYDTDGDNTLMIEGVGTSAASTTSMAYDAAGNQTLAITGYNSSNPETTIARYDGDGNLTQEVDADGDTSDFAYDSVGDQTLAVAGVGSSAAGSTSDFYDGDGNLTLTVNPVGDSTSYQYDADGNQTLEIDGYGSDSAATIHYLYDAAGNQTQEIDPDGNTTSWEYDADGDQTLMIQAYGTSAAATTSYQYDNDGNQTLQVNPNGTSIVSSYDADGNLTSETWYNANGSVANSSSYTYDGDGNILTAGNDAGTYTFGYNADGEQTLVVNPNGVTLNYQYDADGIATEISDSLGDTVTSQYDADGDLISQGYSGPNGAQLLVQLGYDSDGNLTSINRYSNLAGTQLVGTSSYAYDAQGNVTSIVHDNASGTTLDSFNYNYDAADELTQQVANGTTTAYGYDATGQLISAGPTDYNYDANGNPDASGDSVGPNNELLTDGTWNYSYDTNGNETGKTGVAGGPDAGLTWAYAYDPGNELISATETNSQGQTLVQDSYVYDVFGNMIESSVSTNGGPAVITNYVYNGSTLWTTTTASNVPQTFYLSGDEADQFFAQYDATNGTAWYLTNNLGSVCTTMNNSGAAIDNITYDANGNITSQSNSAQQPLIGFDGYPFEITTGLYYDVVRWYNPQTQQWMQQDPTLLAAGPNTYEYVDDEPTNATDPTGQELLALGKAHAEYVRERLKKDFGINTYAFELPGNGTGDAPGKYVGSLPEGVSRETLWAIYPESNFGRVPRNLGDNPYATDLYEGLMYPQKRVLSFEYQNDKGETWVTTRGFNEDKDLSWRDRIALYVEGMAVTGGGEVDDSDETRIKFKGVRPFQGDIVKLAEAVIAGAAKGNFKMTDILGAVGVGLIFTPKPAVTPVAPVAPKGRMVGVLGRVAGGVAIGYTLGELLKARWKTKFALGERILNDMIKSKKIARELLKQAPEPKLAPEPKPEPEPEPEKRAPKQKTRVDTKELKACFAAGTLLYTPQGYRAIETFRVGDVLFSRAEEDATSEVSVKRVEEVFVHTGRIWILRVNGREIRTTDEHPFWVCDRGWVNACALAEGDRLLSHDGQWVIVEAIEDTNRYETVYNLRIADYHTYFVGGEEWGFSVWAHNACAILRRYTVPPGWPDSAKHWSIEIQENDGTALQTHQDNGTANMPKPTDPIADWMAWHPDAWVAAVPAGAAVPGFTLDKEKEIQITDAGAKAAIALEKVEIARGHYKYNIITASCAVYVGTVLTAAGIPGLPVPKDYRTAVQLTRALNRLVDS